MPDQATLSFCDGAEYCGCTAFRIVSSPSSSDRVGVIRLETRVPKGLQRETDHFGQSTPPSVLETFFLLPPHCELQISTGSKPFSQFLISPPEGKRYSGTFVTSEASDHRRTAVPGAPGSDFREGFPGHDGRLPCRPPTSAPGSPRPWSFALAQYRNPDYRTPFRCEFSRVRRAKFSSEPGSSPSKPCSPKSRSQP